MSRKRQLIVQQDQYRCLGPSVTIRQLLEQRHVARSLELDYQARTRLGISGSHISRVKGRGVDFEEHRPYQAGDDIRSIDWRVTARTGRPFTKVFREEKERPVIIGVDQGQTMYFGSQLAFKSVVAAEAAAVICWITVDNGDRVGGVVFSGSGNDMIKPRRSKRSALRFMNLLADYNQALMRSHQPAANGKPHLQSALEQLKRITRHGSDVYLISDFRGFNEVCRQYLHQMALHNSVTCIFVYDALEENLPRPGLYSITDGERLDLIDTHGPQFRENYQQAFASRLDNLRNDLNRMKVPLITLRTDQSVLEQLETWKHKTP